MLLMIFAEVYFRCFSCIFYSFSFYDVDFNWRIWRNIFINDAPAELCRTSRRCAEAYFIFSNSCPDNVCLWFKCTVSVKHSTDDINTYMFSQW